MTLDNKKIEQYYNIIKQLMNNPSCQTALKKLGEN